MMEKKIIDLQTLDGICDSYVAYPKSDRKLPAVILYMDAIGLRQRIFDMANRIASEGYYVIAPNVFYRTKRAPVVDYATLLGTPEIFKHVMPMAQAITSQLAQRDADSFLTYLAAQPEVNANLIGLTGYCMGGGQALRTAGNFPDKIKAVAAFHTAGLATDAENSPHRWFPKIKAEIYIGHGGLDQHVPAEVVARVNEELKKNNLRYTAEVYENCLHGWTMSDLPASNPIGEAAHWAELFKLFKRNLQ